MYHPTYELISGYNEWLTQLAAEGRTLWLGTVLFHHLGRSQPITLSLMEKEMQRIYKGLVTNTTRKPRTAPREKLPILIGSPDRPIPKHRSNSPSLEFKINDGMHYHFILAEPLVSRLKLPLDQHFVANQSMYRGKFGIVSKVKVKRIIELGEQLPDYLFKHITRGSFSRDDLLILPAINKAEANQNF